MGMPNFPCLTHGRFATLFDSRLKPDTIELLRIQTGIKKPVASPAALGYAQNSVACAVTKKIVMAVQVGDSAAAGQAADRLADGRLFTDDAPVMGSKSFEGGGVRPVDGAVRRNLKTAPSASSGVTGKVIPLKTFARARLHSPRWNKCTLMTGALFFFLHTARRQIVILPEMAVLVLSGGVKPPLFFLGNA